MAWSGKNKQQQKQKKTCDKMKVLLKGAATVNVFGAPKKTQTHKAAGNKTRLPQLGIESYGRC